MRILLFVPFLIGGLFLPAVASAQKVSAYRYLAGKDGDYTKAVRAASRAAMPSRRMALHKAATRVELPALTGAELAKALQPPVTDEETVGLKAAGVHRRLPYEAMLPVGRWESLPDNRWVYRTTLRSPEAAGLRLHFTGFRLPQNGAGRVWIHDGTGAETQTFGPYLDGGPFGDGEFWSDVIVGDTLVLEYESDTPELPFTVAEISHLLPGTVFAEAEKLAEEAARGAAASCNLDVSCHAEWQETAKGVGRYLFERDGGTFTCSGTLLATRNQSNTPYFLSADHCVNTEAQARSVQVFWFYQTARCNGTPPDPRTLPRTLGARYLAGLPASRGDASFMQLNGTLPDGVVFSGWNAAPLESGIKVTGIHHPAGDFRRISFGTAQSATPFSGRVASTFVGAFWDGGGLTEGGSSGSGLFSEPGVLVAMLSHGPKADSPAAYCRILPFADNYGRFSTFFPAIKDFLEERSGSAGTAPPATGGGTTGTALVSGQPVGVTLDPVSSPTLFGGAQTFRIDVPANATQLQVRFTTTAQAQLALYARAGSQPAVENGSVVSDHSAQSATGTVTLTIGTGTSPALRTGTTYFVRIANFTANVAVSGSLLGTVTTGGGGGTGGGATGQALTSGAARNLTFPSGPEGRLFNGANGFFIDVPEGATSLQVQLRTSTAGVDVDLYVRRGQDVGLTSANALVADFRSTGDSGDELITITPASSPALQAGRYFIAFGVFTADRIINSTVTATVSGGGAGSGSGTGSGGGRLTPGTASNITLPAVANATLFNGARSFQLTVPENATRVEIELRTSTPGADVDLYARFGQDVAVVNGRVASDLSSTGSTGDETIVLSGEQLRAGNWFIALGVFTPGLEVNASVVARITTQSSGGNQSGVITPGSPGQFRIGPVTSGTLFRGSNNGFRFEVPSNVTRVDVSLSTTPAAADVDLYVRFGQDIGLEGGAVVADYRSEGEAGTENITITPGSNPALRAGTYFVGLGLFTRNVAASGTVTVTFTTAGGGTGAAPTGAILTSGVAAPLALPAVEAPTLFNGEYSYQIEVPEGATSLTVRLASDVSTADTDLYVRRGAECVVEDGRVIADHSATTRFANESVVIDRSSSPPLEPGTYFISVAQFTPGVAVTGRVTASVERASLAPPVSTSSLLRPGEERPFALPAVQGPTLMGGELGFRIDVPAGSGQMRVALACSPETGDVDLFLRYGAEPQIQNGRVVADHASVGDFASESILVTAGGAPPLRAGSYFVGFAVYTPGTPFNCAIRADLDGAASTEIAPSDAEQPESAITAGKTRAGKAAAIAREHWMTEQRPASMEKAADAVLLKKSIGTTVSRKEE